MKKEKMTTREILQDDNNLYTRVKVGKNVFLVTIGKIK